jgi:hypothetical protein
MTEACEIPRAMSRHPDVARAGLLSFRFEASGTRTFRARPFQETEGAHRESSRESPADPANSA